MNTVTETFVHQMISAMGCDPATLPESGVFVRADPGRAENHVTAGYQFGERLIVTCDPAVADTLEVAVASIEPTLRAWQTVAADLEGELLGAGRMQTLPEGALAEPPPAIDNYSLRELSRNDANDLALIERFVQASSEDDLDEAEIDMDNLDPHIAVMVDSDGEIAAFGSAGPFDMVPSFGDIGVLTAPGHRGNDLGKAVVAAVCQSMRGSGLEPVYRCDEDNGGSVGLSLGLGFEIATQLVAFRFATG